tara:strand:+ start:339 stop:1004 length:666 start_codon:yes stop_codon:yes gene_type:complete
MKKLKNYLSSLHNSTKRNYLFRMNDSKVYCMGIAQKYSKDYWDGNRRYGYGGYKYIEGRWRLMAKKLIRDYNLTEKSKILDIGCGKGYLLYEIQKIIPNIKLYGFDISKYAIKRMQKNLKGKFKVGDIRKKFPYKKKFFDLTISLGVLHNLLLPEIKHAISQINFVSKKSYIMVESYRNNKELFNLQCWALTCKAFYNRKEWLWIYKQYKFKGDFEFIYFK